MTGVSMKSWSPANSTISSNLARDLAALHAHDRALQVDVLASGQVGMEAGGHLDERADAAPESRTAARRPQNAGQQLQGRGLAGAVRADDAERLAALHLERHVAHRPELALRELGRRFRAAERAAHQRRHEIAEAVVPLAALELLPDAVEDDGSLAHDQMFSANVNSARWNNAQATISRRAEMTAVTRNGAAGGNVPRRSTAR